VSAEDFEKRASAVPHAGAQIRIERVSGFSANGELASGAVVDASFVAAAFALPSPGIISPVVETPFGWHVLRVIDRVVPGPDSIEQRRRDLAEAVVLMRARSALDTVLRERRQRTEVTVAVEADALTAQVTANQP
jgi:parvulin-like peptidyl-prolyl isomerase